MELKFKKLNYVQNDKDGNPTIVESTGVLPTKAHPTDAGYDLTATRITQEVDEAGKIVLVYHTDIAVELPMNTVGLIFMRSSVSKRSITSCNAVGVVDSGYRGEIMVKFKVTTDALPRIYNVGEKIAQLVVVPYLNLDPILVDELSESDRGDNGFGSTNKIKQDEHNERELGTGDRLLQENDSAVSEQSGVCEP